VGGNGGTIVLPSKQIPICPPFKQETFFQARDMMEQDEIISGPDLGTAGASEGWVSGLTDCPTGCPGPNDDPSLVACCSVGCHPDSTSSCIRYCCSPDSLHLPLYAGPSLLGGLMLMGGLAAAVVVW